MVLEDAVQRSGEKLLRRIREQSEPEIRGFIGELLTAAAKERAAALDDVRRHADADREQAVRDEAASVRAEAQRAQEAALAAARDEAERELARQVGAARAETERIRAELASLEAALAAAPGPEQVLGRVGDGLRRLEQASSLTDVLNALAETAAGAARRAGVVVVEGERIRGWRFVGFEPALPPARQVDLALVDAGIVGEAASAAAARSVVAGGEAGGALPAFLTLPSGANAVAVPVMVGGAVGAIVYGDDGGGEPAAGWRESIEILARHAGRCLEGLTAVRMAQLAHLEAVGGAPSDGPRLPFENPNRRPAGAALPARGGGPA